MKKIIISTGLLIAGILSINAQSIDEAFRYSQLFYGGTARFQAMGGAFTSLGGDLSVLGQNPAGLAVFRSPALSITPQMYFNNSEVNFGDISQDNVYDLNLNQAGVAFPLIKRNDNSGLVSLNLGYSYSKTNNYHENAIIKGTLNNSSMVDYFMDQAQGTDYTMLSGAEGIVFDVWMFDTISGGGGLNYASVFSEYGDNANSDYGQIVRRVLSSEGGAAEHSFSIATNFNDKIFLGFTLGISTIYSYTQYDHIEDDNSNLIYDFNTFSYSDVVETSGKGFSAKLGAIIKPVDFLRLGFAVHSPVVYRLNEYYYDSATGSYDNGDYYESQNDAFRFSYTLTTPLRVTTGAALQLGKKGIVSADYEFVDYKMARYSRASDDYNYYRENQDIREIFDVAHNLRFGAEYRLTSSFYLRGGYALYGSGFARGEDNEDNVHSVLSGGIGIRQSNFYFDLSYAVRSNNSDYFMYSSPDLDPASISYKRNMLSATLGIRL
ncbi:MAG: hypothetical protein V2I37_12220 [Marinilabiliaceae bacterium]|jgi:hypothetical protein|nr:hypothetical protein [Marinilabiliaceae bacterium]